MKNKYTIQKLNNKPRVDKINIYNIKKLIKEKNKNGRGCSVYFNLTGLFFHYFNTKKLINPIFYDVDNNIILKIYFDCDVIPSIYSDCNCWGISRSVSYSYFMSHFGYNGFELYIPKNKVLEL